LIQKLGIPTQSTVINNKARADLNSGVLLWQFTVVKRQALERNTSTKYDKKKVVEVFSGSILFALDFRFQNGSRMERNLLHLYRI
jgi:hypothetical protein